MSADASNEIENTPELQYISYGSEKESKYLPAIRQLISKDLSEPYSIYVYRYFLYQWGHLCFMALDEGDLVGVIVCKLEPHRGGPMRGYIAMLATQAAYRGQGIATKLVKLAVQQMKDEGAHEIALETEVDNVPSLRIYENLGFLRTKRLHRYYLSGSTAFRLILYLKPGVPFIKTIRTGYDLPPEGYTSWQNEAAKDPDLYARRLSKVNIDDEYDERESFRSTINRT